MALIVNRVLVLNSAATKVYDPASQAAAIRVTLFNLGPNAIHVGPASPAPTVTNATPVAATTGSLQLDGRAINDSQVWALAATADQAGAANTVVLIETRD